MIINYSFSSFPQRSVILTATDGHRQISVTEPVVEITAKEWKELENGGPEQLLASCPLLSQKLRQTEQLLASTLQSIQRSSQAIDSGKGFIAYGRELIETLKPDPANKSRIRKYADCLSRFSGHLRTRGLNDINLADLSATDVYDFTEALTADGCKPSTISFYCRILKAIHRTAIRASLINPSNPFK
jgi:hypothetical protein